jgi:hypothetical protein
MVAHRQIDDDSVDYALRTIAALGVPSTSPARGALYG